MIDDSLFVADTLKIIQEINPECGSCSDCGIELVNSVDSFYQSAWTTILWGISSIGGILAIGLPVFINYLNRRKLGIERDEIIKELNIENGRMKEDIKQDLSKELNVLRNENIASTYHIQALVMDTEKDKVLSFVSYLCAFHHYLLSNDYRNMITIYRQICEDDPRFNNISKDELEDLITTAGYNNVEGYIYHIDKEEFYEFGRVEILKVIRKLQNLK